MKRTLVFLTLFSSALFAQEVKLELKQLAEQGLAGGVSAFTATAHTVQGAPYSATVIHESVQSLADGNRIVQKTTGTTARDSQGRTRNDTALPMIGNMSAAGAPHLVFIVDPVAQTSYTLNLDEKTAHAMSHKMFVAAGPSGSEGPTMTKTWVAGAEGIQTFSTAVPPPPHPMGAMVMGFKSQKVDLDKEQAETRTEDLGAQVIEGVNAQGVRTTRTIPAGEIGNDKPIDILTEVWTSSDLKTIVMSRRSDPRSGDQIFRLSNIVRSEPDPSLFTIPADFKTVEAGGDKNFVFYHSKE